MASIIDDILQRFNLKYSDLSKLEQDTLHSWLQALNQKTLTIEKIHDYVDSMRDAVEQELAKSDNGTKNDLFLKARLRNYMLIAAFLTTPQKAQHALETALENVKRK